MTALLQHAFEAAQQLTEVEQDELATRLLAEMAAEDDFDRLLEQTGHKLARLSEEALAELRAGLTLPWIATQAECEQLPKQL
jgi:hypothetical protein